MNYGYARVSTLGQAKGNSLEDQVNKLFGSGCDTVIEEKFTAKNNNRPAFNNLLETLTEGDILTVTKLDRFARSCWQGSRLVEELLGRGVSVNILNMGLMDNTPGSKLIRNIFFAFAEYERDMIIERTQEGKAIAKTKSGFKEGRPNKFTKKTIELALSQLVVNGGIYSYKEIEERMGISKSTLIRENNKKKGSEK